VNKSAHRRPSYLNQYWVTTSLLGVGICYLGRYLGPLIYSGELQMQLTTTAKSLVTRMREDVVMPVYELVERIFLTIRHRGIVILYTYTRCILCEY
jgi:hypothetical protein